MIFMWILAIGLTLTGIGGAIVCVCGCESNAGKIGGAVTSLVICLSLAGACMWYLYDTEAGKRLQNSFKSNTAGGIEREIIVYDALGNELERFSGKFDVEHTEDRIMFDDEKGNRHIIYFKTGTAIVNDIE